MNLNTFLNILKEENLNNFSFDATILKAYTVYFIKEPDCFSVFTTDEKAAVFGKISSFSNESEAYENALKRLRAFK